MKKIIFYNPYIEQWYGKNVFNFVTRRQHVHKYWYILENIIKKYHSNVYIYLDLKENSFYRTFFKSPFICKIFALFEFLFWCVLNKVNFFKLNIIFNIDGVESEDALVAFAFKNIKDDFKMVQFTKAKCKKFFFLNHYHIYTSKISDNLKKVGVYRFLAESDLAKNSEYFKHYFQWYKNSVLILPYVYNKRFMLLNDFNMRENLCLATGSLFYFKRTEDIIDCIDFYNTDTLHPMRKEIYEKQDELKDVIFSRISDLTSEIQSKEVLGKSIIKDFFAKIYNLFYVKQKEYYKFDMVNEYNKYKMFIVPEEITGLPAIGFVEGMACGAAFIGLSSPIYKDMGLIENFHYISYDGSLKDLVKKIRYFQLHNDELQRIAKNGYEFVINNFNGEKIAQQFLNYLNNE